MKWTTYLAVGETESEKKGAKNGQKSEINDAKMRKKV